MGDEFSSSIDDLAYRAVVFLKFNDRDILEIPLEIEDVFYISAAPAVDALVVVTYNADIFVDGR